MTIGFSTLLVVGHHVYESMLSNARLIFIRCLRESVRSNIRFQAEVAETENQFPEFFPISPHPLGSGLPFGFVYRLAEVARIVGLDRLPAPWGLALRILIPPEDDVPLIASRPFFVSTWERNADFFYQHFCLKKSIVRIADESGFSIESVQLGLRNVIKEFGAQRRAGRPPRHHYAA